MSETLVQKPVVPCSVCGVVMVELGPMGDTGHKKCDGCKYLSRKQYHRKYYRKNYQVQELTCIRCGKSYQEKKGVDICQTCRMLTVDLFRESQNQECIYCGKASGTRKFCSHNCLVKTTKLAKKRDRMIDGVIKD